MIGDVAFAAGQIPDQPAIDGAEGELAGFGAWPRTLHIVENPGDFGAGEVGVDQQPGLLADHVFCARPRADWLQSGAVRRSCQTMAL